MTGSGSGSGKCGLEAAVERHGRAILSKAAAHPARSLFSFGGPLGKVIQKALADPAFKVRLFRFVDVFPTLRSPRDIAQHLQEYLGEEPPEELPALWRTGLTAARLSPEIVAVIIRRMVKMLARQFIAADTAERLAGHFVRLEERDLAMSVDLLGEKVLSNAESDEYVRRDLEMLDALAKATEWTEPGASDFGPAGTALPRINLSVKLSALAPWISPADPESAIHGMVSRLKPVLRRASELGALVQLDMEDFALKELTLDLIVRILEEPEFHSSPEMGIAIQAYLQSAEADLRRLLAQCERLGRSITVRLVRGAYWDYETTLARQRNWPVPVWTHKAETDLCYERCTRLLLENAETLQPAFGTHNVRSIAHAIAYAEAIGVHPRTLEFQMLYGMGDPVKAALLHSGFRVREYCPTGRLIPGMAYLIRRLLENTANESFLRSFEAETAPPEILLAPPRPPARAATAEAAVAPFQNEPNTDFAIPQNREAMEEAVHAARMEAGQKWPMIIGGSEWKGPEKFASLNPAHPGEVIGWCCCASRQDCAAAVTAAQHAQPQWGKESVENRAAFLEHVASLLAARRFQLAALEVLECGKPWIEADADVSEAIDFCRYYARQARRLLIPQPTERIPGETNISEYLPRGVAAVIAPWNFPLAILCGMTMAALVCGNAVIIKPAEQSSVIGAVFMRVLEEAGVPPGIANLVMGSGEIAGAELVENPGVDLIAFTGSREVGAKIWAAAGRVQSGQRNLKRAVCEMGGKNAILVDRSADADEAITGILQSAFGYAGQKCSALSRLILFEEMAGSFLERLAAAAAALPSGDPARPGVAIGPVIDSDAMERIRGAMEMTRRTGRVIYEGKAPDGDGYFVPPMIACDLPPGSPVWTDEVFGPLLAVKVVKDLDAAFAAAAQTEYALTGGLYSRTPSTIERARKEFAVGNLYINRAITGAIVGRHPFGGFAMSGGGTKAGGPDYLLQFVVPRVISENTMRRGFHPDDFI